MHVCVCVCVLEKEVRGRVDNNHISLKYQQIARIRLHKKMTVQCPFLIKINYIVIFISIVFFYGKSLFNNSYENLYQWTTVHLKVLNPSPSHLHLKETAFSDWVDFFFL